MGYLTKRKVIENTENAWLANNFSGINPDSIDLTFDDAENTIFNSNYSFKVGNDVYELRSDDLYINGIPQDGGSGGARVTIVCKSNKKRSDQLSPAGTNRKFVVKVAINSIGIRSSVKGEAVHFKLNNGHWKRARASMSISVGGKIYNPTCALNASFSITNPSPNGFKKRSQLKIVRREWAIIWKTYSGEIAAGLYSPDYDVSANLSLTF